jgi:carbohydrate-selective porin OprB
MIGRAAALCCATALAASLAASTAQAGTVKGAWVATGAFGKITLRLAGSGTAFHGTYTQISRGAKHGTASKVTARSDTADGVTQLTLTFTKTRRSVLCGLQGAKLYCQVGTAGTAVFARSSA